MVELALYQPEIASNLGAVMRLAACLGMKLHVIEPCGFPLDDRKLRRAAMDYYDYVIWQKHADWQHFEGWAGSQGKRLLLLTTRATAPYDGVSFTPDDILLFGRESAGVPQEVHARVEQRITIPMAGECRSLNLALSVAITAGEAARQVRAGK